MTITYSDIATRADKNFHARCKRELGIDHYMALVPLAKLAFEEGLKEPSELKRNNTAKRMANLVFAKALAKANK